MGIVTSFLLVDKFLEIADKTIKSIKAKRKALYSTIKKD
jgi:hypothetical protein